jgi:hypothetical protein
MAVTDEDFADTIQPYSPGCQQQRSNPVEYDASATEKSDNNWSLRSKKQPCDATTKKAAFL